MANLVINISKEDLNSCKEIIQFLFLNIKKDPGITEEELKILYAYLADKLKLNDCK